MDKKASVDRRQERRYPVADGAFVLLAPPHSILGQIIEISRSGLSFLCTASHPPEQGPTQLDILLADHSFYFDKIPCTVVSHLEVSHNLSMGTQTIRRCSVRFHDLTEVQTSQLDYFIRNHTTAPHT
ncbi:MAG: PilZ domain-containing protein [Deltaproteobacteria bacterium]|nr:PilZ domain-containing protein [Deltaproteobacteria bacterium]